MEFFFDTETSGFLKKDLAPDHPDQSWIMQLAFIVSDKDRIYTEFSSLIYAGDRVCNPHAQKVHEISVEECNKRGISEALISNLLLNMITPIPELTLVAHNIFFDLDFVSQMLFRRQQKEFDRLIKKLPLFCTMKSTTELCKLPGRYGKYKWPKLTELYSFLFNEEFEGAHDALVDVKATRRCYYKLKEMGL